MNRRIWAGGIFFFAAIALAFYYWRGVEPVPSERPATPPAVESPPLTIAPMTLDPPLPTPAEARASCHPHPPRSRQPLSLLGTLVLTDASRSVALVQEPSQPAIAVRPEHTFSYGKYLVLEIERKSVCLEVRASHRVESLEIDERAPLFPPGASRGSFSEGIRRLGPGHYLVPRATIQKALGNLGEILKGALAVGATDARTGVFQGFLLQFIAQDSPLVALGLEPGDLLTGANTIAFDSFGKGILAFRDLQSAGHIHLNVVRDGHPAALDFDIQ